MKQILLLLLSLLPLAARAEENVAPPAGSPIRTMSANVTSITYNFTAETPVDIALIGQDVYIRGLCLTYPEYWIKGRMNADGLITFPPRQFLFMNEGYDDYTEAEYSYPIYAYGISPDGQYCDYRMTYDADTDTYTSDAATRLCEVADYDGHLFIGDYYTSVTITPSPPSEEGGLPTLLPYGLEAKPYTMTAMEWTQGEVTYDAGLAFDGNDAYLTDFCLMARDTGHCIKGYRQGNDIIFPAGQYIHTYEDSETPPIHFFIYGADYDGATLTTGDLILHHDTASDTYTGITGLMASMGRITSSTVSFAEYLTGIVLRCGGAAGIASPQGVPVRDATRAEYDIQGRTVKGSPACGLHIRGGSKTLRKTSAPR